MGSNHFVKALALLVVGCFLIAWSDRPASWQAIVGVACVALALVVAILGFVAHKSVPATVDLSEQEKQSLRHTLRADGLAIAARQLRSLHPEATLTQTKRTLDTL